MSAKKFRQDSRELRKRIADAMIACGHAGKRTLVDFQDAGTKVLDEIVIRATSTGLVLGGEIRSPALLD
jgi:hypothetical protein